VGAILSWQRLVFVHGEPEMYKICPREPPHKFQLSAETSKALIGGISQCFDRPLATDHQTDGTAPDVCPSEVGERGAENAEFQLAFLVSTEIMVIPPVPKGSLVAGVKSATLHFAERVVQAVLQAHGVVHPED